MPAFVLRQSLEHQQSYKAEMFTTEHSFLIWSFLIWSFQFRGTSVTHVLLLGASPPRPPNLCWGASPPRPPIVLGRRQNKKAPQCFFGPKCFKHCSDEKRAWTKTRAWTKKERYHAVRPMPHAPRRTPHAPRPTPHTPHPTPRAPRRFVLLQVCTYQCCP